MFTFARCSLQEEGGVQGITEAKTDCKDLIKQATKRSNCGILAQL